MTIHDIDALIAAADLADRADRLMLADAMEDAGLAGEAELLRADGAEQFASAPRLADDIVRATEHTEPDEFGRTLAIEQRVTIRTSYDDFADDTWEALLPSARKWWIDFIRDMHDAHCRLAEQTFEVREYVGDALNVGHTDTEDLPTRIMILIDEAQVPFYD